MCPWKGRSGGSWIAPIPAWLLHFYPFFTGLPHRVSSEQMVPHLESVKDQSVP